MSDEEEANFVRKLKRGQGKYKGKLPFKCFKCGRIGYFASKCTYEENQDNEREEELEYQEWRSKHQWNRIVDKKKIQRKKKRLYTEEDNVS